MSEPVKKLRRLPRQGQLTGVCAGLGEYLGVDVTILRIGAVALTLITSGGFLIAYIVMAVIIPSADAQPQNTSSLSTNWQTLADDMRDEKHQSRLRYYLGFALVLFGGWLLLNQLYPGLLSQGLQYIWPVALILLGIIIATRSKSS